MAFLPGYAAPVIYQQFINGTGGKTVTLKITGWNASDEVQRLITTYARADSLAGLQSSDAGIRDWTANVTGNLDGAALLHNLASPIIPGRKGLMGFCLSGTSVFFSVGVLITKVSPASAVAGLITFNFDVAMDADFAGFQFTAPANFGS